MKRIALGLLVLGIAVLPVCADEMVRSAQSRLQADGFYHGKATGNYDSETAAAVTRYQIRHGLAISGKLDRATAKALGIAASQTGVTTSEPAPAAGTWRRLRDGDMQFLKKLNAGKIPPPQDQPAATTPASTDTNPGIDPHAPPPRLAEDVPATSTPVREATRDHEGRTAKERLRDYVGAFVLAGLDPAVGAELEFFAARVDYFGEKGVGRPRIQRDLVRYDRQWPQRQFSLAGDLQVERRKDGVVQVAFPLRYELGNGSRHVSGRVMKTLLLQSNNAGELQIVGVNERKL